MEYEKIKNEWVFSDGIVITKAEVDEVYSYLPISDRQALESSALKEEIVPEILSRLYSLKKKIQAEEQKRREAEALRARREEKEKQKWEEARKAALRHQYLVTPITTAVRKYRTDRGLL